VLNSEIICICIYIYIYIYIVWIIGHSEDVSPENTKVFESTNFKTRFDVLLTVHFSIFSSVINQLDAQKFCFTISLFHASTCFEHMCSKHVEA